MKSILVPMGDTEHSDSVLKVAIDLAKKLTDISDAKVITYKRSHQYKNNIYSLAQTPSPQTSINTQIGLINLDANGLLPNLAPRFMYLWQP